MKGKKMLIHKFKNGVMIGDVLTNSGKKMMCVVKPDGNKQFFDISQDYVIEGQTAYFCANKMILTVCFDDVSQEDIQNCLHKKIKIRFGKLNQKTTMMFCKFGDYKWGDVFVLPALHPTMNDPNKGIDEIILVLCDRKQGTIVGTRGYPGQNRVIDTLCYFDYLSYSVYYDAGRLGEFKDIADMREQWLSFTIDDAIFLRTVDIESSCEMQGMYGLDLNTDGSVSAFEY